MTIIACRDSLRWRFGKHSTRFPEQAGQDRAVNSFSLFDSKEPKSKIEHYRVGDFISLERLPSCLSTLSGGGMSLLDRLLKNGLKLPEIKVFKAFFQSGGSPAKVGGLAGGYQVCRSPARYPECKPTERVGSAYRNHNDSLSALLEKQTHNDRLSPDPDCPERRLRRQLVMPGRDSGRTKS